ncbi:hypothetical protein [Intestinibacillus massiliensis]|uniref:hypothetical protein n=1 Tax=Intestinibacillus massiliensis TaxID=1871029 RepID=UPI001179BF80|nr:hypothetical protein [Intestinibacillus massiliensis]
MPFLKDTRFFGELAAFYQKNPASHLTKRHTIVYCSGSKAAGSITVPCFFPEGVENPRALGYARNSKGTTNQYAGRAPPGTLKIKGGGRHNERGIRQ